MNANGVVISLLLTFVIALMAYTAKRNNEQSDGLAKVILGIQQTQTKQDVLLGVLTERLTNHLDWSEETFNSRGQVRAELPKV